MSHGLWSCDLCHMKINELQKNYLFKFEDLRF